MKKRLLVLLILVVGIFIITGCGNSEKDIKKTKASIKEVQKNPIVGSYEIYELKKDDIVYNKKYIDSLELDYLFDVNDDNTAYMKLGEEEETFIYDKKYFINEKEKVAYTYRKGKLIFKRDNIVLTFIKK